jgi:hypothetical protein
VTQIPARVLEHQLEESLHRWYCDQPEVISVRRQYRWPGTNQRCDLLVVKGRNGGPRCITVVEVKAQFANMETVRQALRYMSLLKRNVDEGTTVHATLAAPKFTAELLSWLQAFDPERNTFATLQWTPA